MYRLKLYEKNDKKSNVFKQFVIIFHIFLKKVTKYNKNTTKIVPTYKIIFCQKQNQSNTTLLCKTKNETPKNINLNKVINKLNINNLLINTHLILHLSKRNSLELYFSNSKKSKNIYIKLNN